MNKRTKKGGISICRSLSSSSFCEFEGVEVEERGKLGKDDERVADVLSEWVGVAVLREAERKTDNKKIYLESL